MSKPYPTARQTVGRPKALPRFRAFLLVAALCTASLLSACGGDEAPSVIMAAPAENNMDSLPAGAGAMDSSSSEEALPLEDEAMELSTVTTGLSGAYAGTEDGCYTLATHEDGSADILYFDYNSLTMTMLDAPQIPTDVFAGHVFHTWGGVTPMVADGNLYLFRLGGTQALVDAHGENGQAAVMQLNVDGTDAVTLTFPAGWTFLLSSAVLADSDNYYFLMSETTADGTAYILVRVDKNFSGYSELHRFADGYEYSIEGWWEKGPLLCAATPLPPTNDPDFTEVWDNRQFSLQTVGMNTGTQTEIFRWGQGDVTSVQGNYIYFWNAEAGALQCQNADSGEQATLAEGFAPDGYVQLQIMRTALDGKLRLQFSTNRYLRDFTVDPVSGEVRDISTGTATENPTVCAEGAEGFLVLTGTRWVNKDRVPHNFVPGMENSSYSPGYYAMPEYAYMAKEDYWAGSSRSQAITDQVYPKS